MHLFPLSQILSMKWLFLIPLALLALIFYLPIRTRSNSRGKGQPDLKPTPDNIDPHIYPLVTALNATGLCKTLASCEGHWLSLFYVSQPYVAFYSKTEFAKRLNVRIDSITDFPWYLKAHFVAGQKLCYRLAIDMSALGMYGTLLLLLRIGFDRDIQDIIKLVQIITNDDKQS